MTEYAFISVDLQRHREGFDFAEDYRDIIRHKSDEGWFFIQAIDLSTHTEPRLDLVFARPPFQER